LTHKAEELGYDPQVILAGRRINDNMGKYIAEQTVKLLINGNKTVRGAKVKVMGITFKENISDIRNSRVIDIINELKEYNIEVIVCDPHADPLAVKYEYEIELTAYDKDIKVDAVVIAVNHNDFKQDLTVKSLAHHLDNDGTQGVVMDVKGMFEHKDFENTNMLYWRL
ncbi:MAG: nucleotide sugar dehydrogenase, partial [Candidatus Omnitrophica bacterium]|nr:nucleotide sugar dehydrogenase [Candidatus Omnitrophota bacterium]